MVNGIKFARYIVMAGTSNSLLYYGSKQTPCIEGILTFTDDKSEDTYRFKLASAAPDEESIQWHRKGEAESYMSSGDH